MNENNVNRDNVNENSVNENYVNENNVNNYETSMETQENVSAVENFGKEPEVENLTYEQPRFEQPTVDQNNTIVIEAKLKSGNGKRFFRKVVALVTSAAVFGVVAGLAFQGAVILKTNEQSAIELQEIDELNGLSDSEKDKQLGELQAEGGVVQTGLGAVTATDVSSVVENVMPAIVAINSSATMTQYDFFGRGYDNEVSGSGSGIIIGQNDNEVLIATNNHVIADATAVEIVFNDDTKATATIKGSEPASDLAVVAVNISDLSEETKQHIKIATLGDSDKLKTGEMAIAIGNALGYGQSVTVGYISALDREVVIEDITLNLLQTDAAINPGNSGGALINAKGEVIGINSVKYSDTNVEGIGYSIPISEAIPIINDLMNREVLAKSETAYLGISGKDVEAAYAEAFNMPVGVYVYSVAKDSAAEKAGITQGDIIVAFNNKPINNMKQLLSALSYTRGGTKAAITLNTLNALENGSYEEKTVEVELGFREIE